MTKRIAIYTMLLLSPTWVSAQQADSATVRSAPEGHGEGAPVLHVERARGEIVVDGVLDDAGWRGAAEATGFTEFQPGEGNPAPTDTRA